MRRIVYFLGILATFYACQPSKSEQSQPVIKTGEWRGVLKPQGQELPFGIEVSREGGGMKWELINASERIPLNDVQIIGDSIHIPLYIFDATLHGKILNDEQIDGYWIKNYAEDYVVPFEAKFGVKERFKMQTNPSVADFNGKWEVDFIEEDTVEKAIGVFEQNGKDVTGTFLTPTGDYRFLEGAVSGNQMKLSCFDGTHAYLFEAYLNEDGTIVGQFWSGKTWHQEWTATRNEGFELPDPYSMTYIKEGYDEFMFQFPNTKGESVSLSDEKYKDQVVVVQLLGSWCPNCMDETRFYTDWYERNHSRGVEIIGLAFERKPEFDYAKKRVENMINKLNIPYDVLIAGTTDKESRAEALPMLNAIKSFPTSIILDRQHRVRKIHTGFSGPGTGIYYEQFVDEFNLFMDKLIEENPI